MTGATSGGTATALSRLTAPLVRDAVRFIDKVLGGRASVERRLAGLDSRMTVDQFRIEQVVWGATGAATGAGIGVLAVVARAVEPADPRCC